MSEEKLRVISIAHTAVSRAAGRLRYAPLAGMVDLDVHLVVPQRWKQFGREMQADPPGDPGVTTHVLPILFPHIRPFSWYLHVYRQLSPLIRQVRPHVIHLWEEPWSLVALQACFLKQDAALVLEVDQNILKRLPPPFEGIRKTVLGRTAHILSRSHDATSVVKACGYRGPVSMIGYGIDTAIFKPLQSSTFERSELVLGYVGRLIEEKGIQDALQAMARTPIPVSLKLMGEGPYEHTIRKMAAELGLTERVSIRPWGKPEDVADFLRSLDATLLLTHTTPVVKEQFGRVIIEAQGCGIPVIGAASGAIPDVIGQGGWIVPERDPEALAKLIQTIGTGREAFQEKSAMALRNVTQRFTYQAVAHQMLAAWKAASMISRVKQ
ncbi:glycosyltransferase [Rhizobium oryzicola]|uniref:Glycosyltransferase n=1 Tax=Rhizobium oryzicola TaxID=1232668 RepID=A0ABT8T3E2_9HYPH|nr:glycosyltransferase [Rhizobium oryzicola]MDO1585255.1 glycosyltransferase [Rhizobium oryzicola]